MHKWQNMAESVYKFILFGINACFAVSLDLPLETVLEEMLTKKMLIPVTSASLQPKRIRNVHRKQRVPLINWILATWETKVTGYLHSCVTARDFMWHCEKREHPTLSLRITSASRKLPDQGCRWRWRVTRRQWHPVCSCHLLLDTTLPKPTRGPRATVLLCVLPSSSLLRSPIPAHVANAIINLNGPFFPDWFYLPFASLLSHALSEWAALLTVSNRNVILSNSWQNYHLYGRKCF